MGEVWRARDTRLDRSVAIKVLPAEFAQNAQLKMRFEREARTISQLNHPNICTLYDVGLLSGGPPPSAADAAEGRGAPQSGVPYLVMELLEGESLADRLAKGPLPLEQVLRYGVQISDALDKAHRAGIVHRDLKPGNIMITKSGAKLLDFGLAKGGGQPPTAVDLTEHRPLTQEGTILGTFQYMAPEQLEGEEADARTDIFALGAVLYEMATGRRAFDGKTKTSLIAAIVQSEPQPMSQIQPLTPPAFEHLVRKCLAKDREDRWQSAHDIAEELRWISEAGSQAGVAAPLIARRKSRERVAWIAALALTAIVAGTVAMRRPRAEPVITSSITAPLHAPFDVFDQATLSPDGNSIAFVAFKSGTSLWIRPIDRNEPRALPSTEGAQAPFWSPNGKSLGFFANGKVKRIAVAGGPPQIICDVGGPFVGGTWNKDDVILFSGEGTGPILRVAATGGKPQPLTKLGPREEAHRWPQFLPDGEHFIFLGDANRTEDHHLKVGSLRDGSSRDLIQAVSNAMYAEPGELLFVRAGSLLAQPFDTGRLALRGEPRVVAEHVIENSDDHHFEFSASSNGRLTYRSASADARLTWVDRSGNVLEVLGEPRRLGDVRRSPDQQRIAIAQLDADGRGDDVWLLDIGRGMTTRLTFDPASDGYPVWSPDGSKIAFSSARTGQLGEVYVTDVANPANVQRLGSSTDGFWPDCWSHDGHFIVMTQQKPADLDIWLYSFQTHEMHPYLSTPFVEQMPALSPDDSWIAYVTNESGRDEVYVERFPSHSARRLVSNGGGRFPRWRADGRELFYRIPGSMLMSVDMTSEKSVPKPLFKPPPGGFEVSADGQRFLIGQPIDDAASVPLTFVSNWMAERK